MQAVSARQAAEQAQENAERLSGELDEALAALDTSKSECSEWQTRATSIEQDSTTRIEHLEGELARETGRSTESRQQVEEVRRRVTQLETQLEAAQVEARTANEEHARLAERVTKLDNDRHLAMQENQTLRRLGQSSVAEAEALATEVASLKTQFEAELKAANELATRNLTEVITELENRERGQLAADERARQLEAELERERAQPHGPSADELARIAELEKTLEAQKLDVEDADEKLIEVRSEFSRPAACDLDPRSREYPYAGAQGAEEIRRTRRATQGEDRESAAGHRRRQVSPTGPGYHPRRGSAASHF